MSLMHRTSGYIGRAFWQNELSAPRFFVLVLCAGIVALGVGFLLPLPVRVQIYLHASVPSALLILLTALVLQLMHLWRSRNASTHRLADVALASLLTMLVTIVVPGRALIENDEANMLATAQAITHTFSPAAVMSGVFAPDGAVIPLQLMLDKRGVMFPIMISAFDVLFGTHPKHAIWASLLAFWVAGFLSIRLARRLVSGPLAVALPVFLCAWPVYTIHARSGVFDVASFSVMLAAVHGTLSFLQAPSAFGFARNALVLAVLAQMRLEQFGIAALLLAVCLACCQFKRSFAHLRRVAVVFSPWLLLPAAWRTATPYGHQLPNDAIQPWAIQNLLQNGEALLKFTVMDSPTLAGNRIIGVLGLVGLLSLVSSLPRLLLSNTQASDMHMPRSARSAALTMIQIAAVFVLLNLVLLSYWWGQPQNLVVVRLFIPYVFLLCLFSIWVIDQHLLDFLPIHKYQGLRWIPLTLACALFVWKLPTARKAEKLSTIPLAANRDAVQRAIDQSDNICNIIILTQHTIPLMVRGINATTPVAYQQIGAQEINKMAGRALTPVKLENISQFEQQFVERDVSRVPGDLTCGRGSATGIRVLANRKPDLNWNIDPKELERLRRLREASITSN